MTSSTPPCPPWMAGGNDLQTSGASAVFGTFNDSSRARLYLDLAKEVDDVSAAADIEKRSQH